MVLCIAFFLVFGAVVCGGDDNIGGDSNHLFGAVDFPFIAPFAVDPATEGVGDRRVRVDFDHRGVIGL